MLSSPVTRLAKPVSLLPMLRSMRSAAAFIDPIDRRISATHTLFFIEEAQVPLTSGKTMMLRTLVVAVLWDNAAVVDSIFFQKRDVRVRAKVDADCSEL